MSWRRKCSKGSRWNPVEGAMVIKQGGGGGDAVRRRRPQDAAANRQVSAAPKGTRGWATIDWKDMTVSERKEIAGVNSPAGMFVGSVDRPDLMTNESAESLRSAMEREMNTPTEHSETFLRDRAADRTKARMVEDSRTRQRDTVACVMRQQAIARDLAKAERKRKARG